MIHTVRLVVYRLTPLRYRYANTATVGACVHGSKWIDEACTGSSKNANESIHLRRNVTRTAPRVTKQLKVYVHWKMRYRAISRMLNTHYLRADNLRCGSTEKLQRNRTLENERQRGIAYFIRARKLHSLSQNVAGKTNPGSYKHVLYVTRMPTWTVVQ